MICLGVDTLTDYLIRGYRELDILSGKFALAEAGIALILERAGAASARGARVYGEVKGYGIASDGLGVGQFDPRGHGLERAMRIALERSGLEPADITSVLSAAAGYQAADAAEKQALSRVFGDAVPVASPKQLLGEPVGAGGTLNAVLALKSWESGGTAPGPVLINSSSLGGTHFSIVLTPSS
jgi:3-oxoacyl-[acyl-carrier-protein] synthase II